MNHSPQNYALWLLGRRDRSIGEIKEKLASKDCSKKEIDEVIVFLRQNNFVNDERFAKNYIQNQLILKPLGKYQLKMKLKRKLVPEETIEKSLDESGLDEEELARTAADKWLKKQNYELRIMNYEEKQKNKERLARHLISRGFGWDIIKEIFDKLLLSE